jgi:hydroxyacylglutathione hydrolase
MIIITEKDKEKETIVRLARVGFDKIEGYLDGGFEAWQSAGETIDLIIDVEADELAMDIPFDQNLVIVDVRKETEYGSGHIKDALNIPLTDLTDPGSMADLDDKHNIYVHCAGGYRSVIASSLLKREGIHNIRNVVGGWGKIKELPDKFEIEKDAEVLN